MKKLCSTAIFKLLVIICSGALLSCSEEDNLSSIPEDQTVDVDQSDLSAKALNDGSLDDRDSKNSYREVTLGSTRYGQYRIDPTGNTDPSNSVRIERRFNDITFKAKRRLTFSATYRIDAVDKPFGTYIAQTHYFNNSGSARSRSNPNAKGPAYLVRAVDIGNNKFKLYRENIDRDGGKFSNGGRSNISLGEVTKNQDFTLKIVSGYNVAGTAGFTTIYLNNKKVSAKNHSSVTDRQYFRYGAYQAFNNIAKVYVRNTKYSVSN